MSNKKIKIAIAGVGNCCQALLEGIEYYRQNPDDTRGLMNPDICGYKVTDIVPVAAFDINAEKVGKDLSEAIFVNPTGHIVTRGSRYPGITFPSSEVPLLMAILSTWRSSLPNWQLIQSMWHAYSRRVGQRCWLM